MRTGHPNIRSVLFQSLLTLCMLLISVPTSALTLNEAQKLLTSDGSELWHFGNSIDLDGDTVLFGVKEHDELGDYSGAAYVLICSE